MTAINKKNTYIWDIAFILLAVAGFIFMLWKCRYGTAFLDETFYLTIPYRILQGDDFLIQEWHLAQMSGFLLLPFMKIYLAITSGSMEGMMLTFRYIYTVIQFLAALFIYGRLRNINKPGAAAGAICFMLYAPFGIMALSYNSMGIICLTLALVIMLTARRAVLLQQAVAGLLFAGAVLCCPYLIMVYAVYLAAVIIAAIYRKCKKLKPAASVFTFKSIIFFTIGAAILAALFGAFVLSRGSIGKILEALPNMLNDPNHPSRSVFNIVLTYFTSVVGVSKLVTLSMCAVILETIIAGLDKKRREHGIIYLLAASALTVISVAVTVWYTGSINFIMFPINIMAPLCAMLSWDDIQKKLLCVFWIPGMLYTLCMHASSNTGFYAISSGATVAVVVTMVMIGRCGAAIYAKGKVSVKALTAVCLCVVLVGQLGTLSVIRYKTIFWSNWQELQSTAQESGLEKGLYISDYADELFENSQAVAGYINENYPEAKTFVSVSGIPWIYLMCSEKENASYSAWLIDADEMIEQEDIDRLVAYYKINPEKVPDLIYMGEGYSEFIDDLTQFGEYEIETIPSSGDLIISRVN